MPQQVNHPQGQIILSELHHVGIVVPSLRQGRAWYEQLGFETNTSVYVDPIQRVSVQFIQPGADVQIELIEPLQADSPVSSFLAKRGPGLHHLCYEVNNIDRACDCVRKQGGIITCEPVPAVAFQERKIAFVYWNGNIIEFLEKEK